MCVLAMFYMSDRLKNTEEFTLPQPFQRPTQSSSSPSASPQESLLSGLCTPTDNEKQVKSALDCGGVLRLCENKDRPACLSAGFDLQTATTSMSHYQSHQQGPTPESSH